MEEKRRYRNKRCRDCDFVTESGPGLKIHIARVHPEKKDKNKKLKEKEELSFEEEKKQKEGEKNPEEEEEEEEGWKVGDDVCVRLTDLESLDGYEEFNFCHMNGRIQKLSGNSATLQLDNGQTVEAGLDRLNPCRVAEVGHAWEGGAKVEILEVHDGIEGWWEARIVGKVGKNWRVRWLGEYEIHGDESVVSANSIRSGTLDP